MSHVLPSDVAKKLVSCPSKETVKPLRSGTRALARNKSRLPEVPLGSATLKLAS